MPGFRKRFRRGVGRGFRRGPVRNQRRRRFSGGGFHGGGRRFGGRRLRIGFRM